MWSLWTWSSRSGRPPTPLATTPHAHRHFKGCSDITPWMRPYDRSRPRCVDICQLCKRGLLSVSGTPACAVTSRKWYRNTLKVSARGLSPRRMLDFHCGYVSSAHSQHGYTLIIPHRTSVERLLLPHIEQGTHAVGSGREKTFLLGLWLLSKEMNCKTLDIFSFEVWNACNWF